MRTVEIRCVYLTGDELVGLSLQDNERVVSVEREGSQWWVYVERVLG